MQTVHKELHKQYQSTALVYGLRVTELACVTTCFSSIIEQLVNPLTPSISVSTFYWPPVRE
jgi:hypothetical protein